MGTKHIEIKNKLDKGLSLKVSRFKEVIKKTSPHKHDEYFELIFLAEGEGFHTIETEQYQVSAPDFYFLNPGQLHFWQFTSIPRGFVIIFREDEFNNLREISLIEMVKKLSETTRIKLQDNQYPQHLLEEIFHEFRHPSEYSSEIIHGLLKALTGRLLQLKGIDTGISSQSPAVYERFSSLLMKEIPKLRKVHEYADLLHVTPQNLNAICKKHSKKTAGQLINSQLLLEAKRYILHTGHTINEIAGILEFTDASHLVKFFRKNEGITPSQFREQHFQ
ncbi:MAG: helix-turn-helix domain-containing protein [Bacteroidota bacterium]